ncbi:urea ABC transporter permease [Halomicroarcula sp. GCM10025709]|uniref:ABC transporter permease subunit n=1 Tax=Haloarcula TaxID=2237 RepID=UPI0024C34ACB|nr:urea ABC transporter permease [Halomicroarcula sp. YJ-61-S]
MATGHSGGADANAEGLLDRLVGRFEGPNTVGNSRRFWAGFAVAVLALAAYPLAVGSYQASRFSLFLVYAFLGLSLSVVWGYAGILSFGQVVFFGFAGYTFGVVSVNFATPAGITAAFVVAVIGGALVAATLGYFMFYGGVRNVYVTIITLVSTLVLHTFMAQTAGDAWTIGEAALGGFNGMPTIPNLALGVGGAAITFDSMTFYYFVLALLLATYLGLRALVNSDYGRVMVAVREDEDRTRMFGYDVKRVKLAVFTLGGALAGLSGVLYAAWGNYMSPGVFELTFASLPVIWVSVGGRKTLLGAVVATVGIEFFRNSLGGELAFVIVGALLLLSILALPGGIVPYIHESYTQRRGSTATSEPTEASTEVVDP